MEEQRDQSQRPPQAQQPSHRDIMFCHECRDEWYRDEHGLQCPECHSDFTEIIEENTDPRPLHDRAHDGDDDEMPPLIGFGMHPLPFTGFPAPRHARRDSNGDPGEDDIGNFQFREVAPGSFTMTGTVYRTISPSGRRERVEDGAGGHYGQGLGGALGTLLSSLIGAGSRSQSQSPGQTGDQTAQGQEGQSTQASTPGGPQVQTQRFTYTAGARLHPRDTNNPGPHMEPVDELSNVLVGIMAAFGEPPGPHEPGHFHSPPPINPLVQLFAHTLGHGHMGDAVYSQEALDRIVTQLMEQNATSNAPGPASQQDIDALPRKEIDIEDLGSEGRAECSICMEEVNIGEKVTELPCHHWFHHPCISAWLSEHDTCPHCRQGITKPSENSGNVNQSSASAGGPGSSPPQTMPRSFVSGEGTTDNPYVWSSPQAGSGTGTDTNRPGSSPPQTMPGSFVSGEGTTDNPYVWSSPPAGSGTGTDTNRPGSAADSNSGGSISDRLRRGLFGPQR